MDEETKGFFLFLVKLLMPMNDDENTEKKVFYIEFFRICEEEKNATQNFKFILRNFLVLYLHTPQLAHILCDSLLQYFIWNAKRTNEQKKNMNENLEEKKLEFEARKLRTKFINILLLEIVKLHKPDERRESYGKSS